MMYILSHTHTKSVQMNRKLQTSYRDPCSLWWQRVTSGEICLSVKVWKFSQLPAPPAGYRWQHFTERFVGWEAPIWWSIWLYFSGLGGQMFKSLEDWLGPACWGLWSGEGCHRRSWHASFPLDKSSFSKQHPFPEFPRGWMPLTWER